MKGRVLSLNVGLPREVEWRGRTVRTGIFKAPVAGRRRVEGVNVDGDGQADLRVHGGPDKSVYAYPAEHYPGWRQELERPELGYGAFGENLTTEGLDEETVHIGDRLRAGGAELRVTQPRVPCFKLGLRFDRPDLVKRFARSGRSGFYLSVVGPGELGAGDPVELLERAPDSLPVARLLEARGSADAELVARAAAQPALPEEWREELRQRLARLQS